MPPRQPLPSSARAHVPLLQSIGKTVTTVKRRNELLEDIDDEDERPREEAALKAAETRMGAAIQKVIDCPKTERKPLLVLNEEQRLALRDIYSKTEAYRKGKRHDNIGLEVEAMSEAIEYAFRREEKEPLVFIEDETMLKAHREGGEGEDIEMPDIPEAYFRHN